jgi:hypothetical protein
MRKGSKNFCSLLKINFPKQREPRNASRNQQTKTGINQEQEAMHDLRLILKKKKPRRRRKYLPMPLLTTAPSPSCWSLARIFLVTNLGVSKPMD